MQMQMQTQTRDADADALRLADQKATGTCLTWQLASPPTNFFSRESWVRLHSHPTRSSAITNHALLVLLPSVIGEPQIILVSTSRMTSAEASIEF